MKRRSSGYTIFAPQFLSLPIRRSLDGVSWASLSVRWLPTEAQKRRRRDTIRSPWLPEERQESRPPLHPLGNRRFPFERLYARMSRVYSTASGYGNDRPVGGAVADAPAPNYDLRGCDPKRYDPKCYDPTSPTIS